MDKAVKFCVDKGWLGGRISINEHFKMKGDENGC